MITTSQKSWLLGIEYSGDQEVFYVYIRVRRKTIAKFSIDEDEYYRLRWILYNN